MNQITLTNASINSGTGLRLLNGDFSYAWKNQINKSPVETSYGAVETQFYGWENPVINLVFYIPIENTPSGSMTWAYWNSFVRSQMTASSNVTYLTVTAGESDTPVMDYSLSSSSTGTSQIAVTIDDYNLKMNPADSRNANFWTIQARLTVTKPL